MIYRLFLTAVFLSVSALFFTMSACNTNESLCVKQKEGNMVFEITKPDEEWKKSLDKKQFEVARKKGTEPPFTGEYWNCKEVGIYQCICCGNDLFDSKVKFDSGTGWPSFWDQISQENIHSVTDTSHGMRRIEVMCKRCGAHLGHLFSDGPPPTGLRYCINSASLRFVPGKKE